MTARRMFLVAAVLLAAVLPGGARADMPGCDLIGGGDSFTNQGACCDTHDKCYADNGCDANSWSTDEGAACSKCNADVAACFSNSTPGPSICTLVPGHGTNGTICQDPGWNCGWYCWSWMVQPSFGSCQGVCTSACGQWDGCSSNCPLYGYGWDCDSCFGCTNCGDCTCGGSCRAGYTCDPNTNNCYCTSTCDHPWCGQTDSCGVNTCPNSDDTCTGAGGYTNACNHYCAPVCSWYDCAGTCNGSATVDCAGVCNGGATYDACGVCGGDGSECGGGGGGCTDCSCDPNYCAP